MGSLFCQSVPQKVELRKSFLLGQEIGGGGVEQETAKQQHLRSTSAFGMVMEAGGGNRQVRPPGLAGVESTPAYNDMVWDKSMVFLKPGLNPSELRAAWWVFLCVGVRVFVCFNSFFRL